MRTPVFILLSLAMLTVVAPAASQSESTPDRPAPTRARPAILRAPKAHHIHFTGDIEAAQDVAVLSAALSEAVEAGAQCIVLQLSGDRVRPDLLVPAARAVRDSTIKPIVFLSDASDRRAGTGQLIIALSGSRCVIASGMTIIGNQPGELSRYMPDEAEEDSIHNDALALTEPLLESRLLPEELAGAILLPAESTWLVAASQTPSGPRWDIRHAEPGALDGRAISLISLASGNKPSLRLAADEALALRLADANTNSLTTIFADAGFGQVRRADRKLASGLSGAREVVIRGLDGVESLCRDADRELDQPAARDSVPRPKDYREAAAAAKAPLDRADERLKSIDAALGEYPEVLRTLPPGTAELDRQPRAFMPVWRRRVDGARREVEQLRERCRDYESR